MDKPPRINIHDKMAIKQKRIWPAKTARDGGGAASCNSIFSDLIDNSCGLELLGCDDSCTTGSRDAFGSALHLRDFQSGDLNSVDYSSLHDACIESLLHEQSQLLKQQQQQKDRCRDFQDDASGSLGFESVESFDQSQEDSRKRRRPIKLSRRRTPPRVSRISTCSTEASVFTVSFADLDTKHLNDPAIYFHPQCRMQKDKGLGEPVGSKICALGREACLEKLRAKMRLLAQHALSEASKASVKRKNAIVSERNATFVETRSLVELRMGFLSMQYGVLLRWDVASTATITMVVLRKMCHDSFLPRKSVALSSPRSYLASSETSTGSRQSDRIRASLLQPPFLVHTPAVFAASAIEVRVASASGLNPRSTWIIQLAYEDCLENFVLRPSGNAFVPTERGLRLTRNLRGTQAPTTLEVKLYERRRRQQRRLVTTRRIPLDDLQPQYTSGPREYKRMPLALTHDSNVYLEAIFMSDALAWLQEELQTRKTAHDKETAERLVDDRGITCSSYDSWNWLLCCSC